MESLAKIAQYVQTHPRESSAQTLRSLVAALSEESNFWLPSLYDLNYEHFELAVALLKEWRLGHYTVAADEGLQQTMKAISMPLCD
ncbi:MAG: hypothetical protein M0037_03890 [Betaproteobacteria bacterium]|nr:hypothetical protein [Betaproteobacteria bacterium]